MSSPSSWRRKGRSIRRIAGRETAESFDSPIAYVMCIAAILLANTLFMSEFFLGGVVVMTPFFDTAPSLLAVFLPAATMRLWAEERRLRTMELLLTLPVEPGQAVLGKFLSAGVLLGVFLVGSLPIPLLLAVLGSPDWGLILSGYLGVLLLSGVFLAVGCLCSSLVRDQAVAFVLGSTTCLGSVLLGHERVIAILDGWWPGAELGARLAGAVSVLPAYEGCVAGVLTLSAVVWCGALTVLGLWATTLCVRRIRE